MDARYDISKLFEAAFGMQLPFYIIPSVRVNANQGETYCPKIKMNKGEWRGRKTYLGTNFIMPTRFVGGEYYKYKPNGELTKTTLDDIVLPPVTLIDFRRAKNITKTDMLGSDGTVKEIYGFDDWIFTARGLALSRPGYYAYQKIQDLLEFENLADSIEVSSFLFSEKNITRIVIENIEIGQLEGQPDTIPFTIQGCSDNPIELVLTEKSLMQ